MLKTPLEKNSSGTIERIAGRIRGFISLPMGISPKVNVIAQLKFELTLYDFAAQYFIKSLFTYQPINSYSCWNRQNLEEKANV